MLIKSNDVHDERWTYDEEWEPVKEKLSNSLHSIFACDWLPLMHLIAIANVSVDTNMEHAKMLPSNRIFIFANI